MDYQFIMFHPPFVKNFLMFRDFPLKAVKKAAIPISPVAHAPNAVENAIGRLRLEIATAAQKWQAWNMRMGKNIWSDWCS